MVRYTHVIIYGSSNHPVPTCVCIIFHHTPSDCILSKATEHGGPYSYTPVFHLHPQVILSKGHGYEVDLWSLGILIYEMLSGEVPFTGATTYALYSRVLKGEFEMPSYFSAEAKSLVSGMLKNACAMTKTAHVCFSSDCTLAGVLYCYCVFKPLPVYISGTRSV